MQGTNWFGGRLVDLTPAECRELLADREVVRVAWCSGDGPVVLPVNCRVRDDTIWVRTAPYTQLAQQVGGQPVAVEVDDVDDFTRSGWSVLARGRAELVSTGTAVSDPSWAVPDTWVEGSRTLVVRIVIEGITGRRLMAT